MSSASSAPQELIKRLRDGNVAALARGISLVEAGSQSGRALHQAVRGLSNPASVIGVTGPPGTGKSTLIDALVTALRRAERKVAVIAIDPSSPISGGAVLGDRTRMGNHTLDPGVFIRSVSCRGHVGGLSHAIQAILDVVTAARWPLIILETVGAGQSETEVAEIADVNLVVNAPGLGDDIQAMKAGILEIADVLVVNKADLPFANRTARQLSAALSLRAPDGRESEVLSTVATDGRGLDVLLEVIDRKLTAITPALRKARMRRRVIHALAREAAASIERKVTTAGDIRIETLCDEVLAGACDPEEAVARILTVLCEKPD